MSNLCCFVISCDEAYIFECFHFLTSFVVFILKLVY
nr:MAG TPA: hypothetical protein [Caudoviricetes sp.]